MKIAKGDGMRVPYALGSCIGLCFHDPRLRLGALLHIMLPLNMEAGRKNPLKYADTGIKETLKQLESMGASRSRMIVKIAGGAKMFEMGGAGGIGNIGERNVRSVEAIMRTEQIHIMKKDVGLNYARTMMIDVDTGIVRVRTAGRQEVVL